jgi:hypothetical protein
MSFDSVLRAIYYQIKGFEGLSYVGGDQFKVGFAQSYPRQGHTIILEPVSEEDLETRASSGLVNTEYILHIYARLVMPASNIEGTILGTGKWVGLLKFTEDIRTAIAKGGFFGYNRKGSSEGSVVSEENIPFNFTAESNKIKVSINGNDPVNVFCGYSMAEPEDVATLIQEQIRNNSKRQDDCYDGVTVSWNSERRSFKIETADEGADRRVNVFPDGEFDCSGLLGFDNPTELMGRKITNVNIGKITALNTAWPARYRILPIEITEEKMRDYFKEV